jgi:hypothetical protein
MNPCPYKTTMVNLGQGFNMFITSDRNMAESVEILRESCKLLHIAGFSGTEEKSKVLYSEWF